MAKPLGPGVRVYIGWTVPHMVAPGTEKMLCNCGTIESGPVPADHIFFSRGSAMRMDGVAWRVNVDGQGNATICAKLLTPIDDDDDQEELEDGKQLKHPWFEGIEA